MKHSQKQTDRQIKAFISRTSPLLRTLKKNKVQQKKKKYTKVYKTVKSKTAIIMRNKTKVEQTETEREKERAVYQSKHGQEKFDER